MASGSRDLLDAGTGNSEELLHHRGSTEAKDTAVVIEYYGTIVEERGLSLAGIAGKRWRATTVV